jgi:hypothetical protein
MRRMGWVLAMLVVGAAWVRSRERVEAGARIPEAKIEVVAIADEARTAETKAGVTEEHVTVPRPREGTTGIRGITGIRRIGRNRGVE